MTKRARSGSIELTKVDGLGPVAAISLQSLHPSLAAITFRA
jgi:hypothetical protein